jgi:hypothetical protein
MNLPSDRAKRAFVAFGLATALGLGSLAFGAVTDLVASPSATHSGAGVVHAAPMSRQP